MMQKERRESPVSWEVLLREAVEKPGLIHEAYCAFHNYSLGNQMAAAFQCALRDIPIGPLDTFKGWEQKGRRVRRGEKALWLCVPYTCRVQKDGGQENDEEPSRAGQSRAEQSRETITGFDWKPRWFTLLQTDNLQSDTVFYREVPPNLYNNNSAMKVLLIEEVPFEHLNGNVQGYARARQVAVSPIAALPHKTLFHEMAHVLLGHTERGECSDEERLPKNLREVEAESVAYLCCENLGLPGGEYSRGYIQHWLQGEEIPESSARRIFSIADKILKAGKEQPNQEPIKEQN
jgi:hypothetical protein